MTIVIVVHSCLLDEAFPGLRCYILGFISFIGHSASYHPTDLRPRIPPLVFSSLSRLEISYPKLALPSGPPSLYNFVRQEHIPMEGRKTGQSLPCIYGTPVSGSLSNPDRRPGTEVFYSLIYTFRREDPTPPDGYR